MLESIFGFAILKPLSKALLERFGDGYHFGHKEDTLAPRLPPLWCCYLCLGSSVVYQVDLLGANPSADFRRAPYTIRSLHVGHAGAATAREKSRALGASFLTSICRRVTIEYDHLYSHCFGALVFIFLSTAIHVVSSKAYPCINTLSSSTCEFAVPDVKSWRAVSIAVSSGTLSISTSSGITVLTFMLMVLSISAKYRWVPPAYQQWVPDCDAVGIAFVHGLSNTYPVSMMFGSIILFVWRRRLLNMRFLFGYVVAAAIIAGEGLGSIVNAVLQIGNVSVWTAYFGIMLAVDIAEVVTNEITAVGYLSNLTTVAAVILLSRFFLNLWSTVSTTPDTESNPSDLRFSIEQSFGGSIDFGNEDGDEVAEEGENDDEGIEEIEGHPLEHDVIENDSHPGEP
ncbi:hypothetical protein FOMPIDRAFT_82643 [Fomitopsis schrenkii]|uniref:Uncharacterized protein n=1 Tax=Fomitopsis schrenkii TaxID=2126942 RepID=S8E3T3_FOMSC|nr:hypothetical protein FOMPIDRAFT_82643 [Fomitopsis schrenkii]